MCVIVKPDVLTKCELIFDFKNIGLNDKKIIVRHKGINIGFAPRSEIT